MNDPEDTVTFELDLTWQETTPKNTRRSFQEESMRRGWKDRKHAGNLIPKECPVQERTLPM